MRTLYLPKSFEHSSTTQRLLERTVQDTVRTDKESRHYHAIRAAINELEHSIALSGRLEMRPWLADTQQPGSVVTNDTLPSTTTDQLFYGVPDNWEAHLIDSFAYTSGMYTDDGVEVTSADVDRAIIRKGALLCQVGQSLYRISDANPYGEEIIPASIGVIHGGDFVLAPLDERNTSSYKEESSSTLEVAVQINGTSLVLAGPGRYKATITYVGARAIQDGDDISDTYQLSKLLNCELAGERVSYINTDGVITIPTDAGEEDVYTLYYEAVAEYTYDSSRTPLNTPFSTSGHRIDFSDAVPYMYNMVTNNNIVIEQQLDTLCYMPGVSSRVRIDRTGFVGEVNVGHTIDIVLPTQHHVIVANANNISLVEYDAGMRVLTQPVSEHTIVGLTWTPNGELGMITAVDAGFELYALRDVRNKSANGWTVA